MQDKTVLSILSICKNDFFNMLLENNLLYVALFGLDKHLIYANHAMEFLFKGEPSLSITNPTLDEILNLDRSKPLVFQGFLTIGDYTSINTSIMAHVYVVEDKILIVGGINVLQLIDQNKIMHQLNREINNLQRELMREKQALEHAMVKLNEVNEDLRTINATKDKFFSIIAHDLRSPFNSLINFTSLLAHQSHLFTPEELNRFAVEINKTARHTHTLLENLLEWSRLQTGKIELKAEPINPTELVEEVALLCQQTANAKNIRLETNNISEAIISADKEMIKFTIRNLVNNAIKFTFAGGTVKIETELTGNEIVFAISDTGIGIDQKYLDKLFELDCNLSIKGTAGEKGTGLGLILCKEFVEKHNGRIWADSEVGKGSIFYFTTPLNA